jgi:hypothetical protein
MLVDGRDYYECMFILHLQRFGIGYQVCPSRGTRREPMGYRGGGGGFLGSVENTVPNFCFFVFFSDAHGGTRVDGPFVLRRSKDEFIFHV